MFAKTNRLDRALATLQALSQPITAGDRFTAGSQELQGITLSGASEDVRAAIESWGIQFNAAFEKAPTSSPTAIAELEETEAGGLAEQLKAVCELVRDEETERILAHLHRHQGVLPEEAIKQIRRQPDWLVPRLLHECQQTVERFENKAEGQDPLHDSANADGSYDSLLFLSLFLFSELNLVESVPVMLRALKLPDEDADWLFDDALNDQVPLFLAQFCASDIDVIDGLIRDPNVYLYVRWAAVEAYSYLVRDQRISLVDAVNRLGLLFQETKVVDERGNPTDEHPFELSAAIAKEIMVVGGASLSTIGKDDSDWDFVEKSFATGEEFQERAKTDIPGEQTPEQLELPPTRLADCLAKLRGYGEFDAPPPPVTPRPSRPVPMPSRPARSAPNPTTISSPERIGRNAPCPCGSGKKHKKCCMLKQG